MNKSYLAGNVKAVDDGTSAGAFEVILSTPTLDRDGEVIDAKAFDPLPDHITFDIDHGMSVEKTVGSGKPFYEGDDLKVRGSFSSDPLAQSVRQKIIEGHIRTTSVAFMDAKREVKDGVPHIVKGELLNGAFVAIPSNRQALVVAAKSLELADRTDGRKAIAGSYEALRDQLRDALRDANPDAWWVYVLATFDDSVVYEVDGRDGVERFQAPYSIGDGGALTIAAGTKVDIIETIEPAKGITDALIARIKQGARNSTKDAERLQQIHDLAVDNGAECKASEDGDDKTTATDPDEKAAAPAAADSLADVTVARAYALAAEAALVLID